MRGDAGVLPQPGELQLCLSQHARCHLYLEQKIGIVKASWFSTSGPWSHVFFYQRLTLTHCTFPAPSFACIPANL